MSQNISSDEVKVPDTLVTKISWVVFGFGNLVHKQFVKGLAFLAIEIGFIAFMVSSGFQNLINLMTLGTVETAWVEVPGKLLPEFRLGDNSMLFLLFGVLTCMITAGFIWAGYCSHKSAKQLQLLDAAGKPAPSILEDIKLLLDERFHITLLFLPITGILIFSVLPLIYMICIAFTNYDRDHQVPGNLFHWVGLKNFGQMLGGDPRMSHTFFGVLVWTLIWAFFATFLNYFLGIIVALVINQKEIKEYVGLVRAHFSDSDMSNYEQQGRLAIINSIPDMHIIETAQANAARALVPMIVQMGYREENITIAFRKNLSFTDIIKRTMER